MNQFSNNVIADQTHLLDEKLRTVILNCLIDSRTNLAIAKTICYDANDTIRKLQAISFNNNLLISNINYYLDFIKNQLKLLENVINMISFKIKDRIIKNFNANYSKLTILNKNMNHIIDNLKNITIEKNLIVDSNVSMDQIDKRYENDINNTGDNSKKFDTLYDFLSIDENLNNMNFRYNQLKENKKKIKNLLEELIFNKINTKFNEFNNVFKNIENKFNIIYQIILIKLNDLDNNSTDFITINPNNSNNNSNNNKNNNKIETQNQNNIIVNNDINRTYENEMVNLLQSMTHHYDQCQECYRNLELFQKNDIFNMSLNEYELLELIEIIRADSLEVPNVLQDLNELSIKIKNENKLVENIKKDQKIEEPSNIDYLDNLINSIYDTSNNNNNIPTGNIQTDRISLNDLNSKLKILLTTEINSLSKNLIEFNDKDLNNNFLVLINNLDSQDFTLILNKLLNNENSNTNNDNNTNDNNNIYNLKELISTHLSLISFLFNFKKSYYLLILEIRRRIDLNKSLQDLIDQFIDNINLIEKEDSTFKNDFLDKNGQFIPSNLYYYGYVNNEQPGYSNNNVSNSLTYRLNNNINENFDNNKKTQSITKLPYIEIYSQFEPLPELSDEIVNIAQNCLIKLGEEEKNLNLLVLL
ncbi:uncharacterized protein ASCRUDRAFT_76805 [Ascoidea rubescens DSM 1968]|uniref:Autophagy-related protein 17 n=1 Tax=Ascoidea rubescens DSM 1968 TaxID=1344418 RepID=A0A1D2VE29_9ASCO|nr:hypothetical protein ASCRUDRAFT_76805 [Ascoidea rubescens DSM 1968]ODV59859.1 hypothetical protein ASCRUDRAFT_76805 [Ascoidea rubescens DSM 1968]